MTSPWISYRLYKATAAGLQSYHTIIDKPPEPTDPLSTMHKLTTLLTLLSSTLALSLAAWPDLPFTVSGRDILSASGSKVIYAGVNWPGAADAMLPEGLQYNSIENIVGFVKDLGMNVVRLTYAIEMIDDIFDDSPNQSLEATLKNALGEANATVVLGQVLERNPQFTAETTRLEVCSARDGTGGNGSLM